MSGSGLTRQLVPIVAILAIFSVPVLGILRPILSDLVPLAYIVTILTSTTLCARYLMSFHHRLKMQEIEKRAELASLEAERYRAAEALIASDDPVERKVREIEGRKTVKDTSDLP